MSYIENNLLSGEKIYYQTKRHWIIFFTPFVFLVLAIAFLMLHDILVLLGYLFLFLTAAQAVMALTTYLTSEFGVTNKRVLVKIGFIRRRSWETILQRIAGIEVEQSIFGRILGFGTIIIQSTGGGKDVFHGIDSPLKFRRKVQEQIETTLSADTMVNP